MNEIQAWRFLVSRNQFLDYRTVVAPDFMCQANIASLLAKAAEGDLTNDDSVYYREIHGSKVGDLTIIYRVVEAQARDVHPELDGALKDSFGRDIYFIEGIVIKGVKSSMPITSENLGLNHRQLINDYRNFWEWVSPQPAIASELAIFEPIEDNATLNRVDLPAYFIGSKKELVLTKVSQPSSEIKENKSDTLNKQIPISITSCNSYGFDGEVHQCFFQNETELIVYFRADSFGIIPRPHDHKVVVLRFNLNFEEENRTDLVRGKLLDRSIERICLSANRSILVTSNKKLLGNDNSSNRLGKEVSFRSGFVNSFDMLNNPDNNETEICEGGGELISVSKDCTWVAATDNAQNIDLFDIEGGGKRSPSFSRTHESKIVALSTSLYENTFASGDESGLISLWDCNKHIDRLKVFKDPIDAIAISPCDRLIVCSGNNGEIRVFQYQFDKVIREPIIELQHFGMNARKSKVNDLSFSPDGKMFASAGDDGSIRLWNLGKGQSQDGQLLSGHDKSVMSISFSPNGKLLASGSKDKTVRIWQQFSGLKVNNE
jgi:WD40 repeat protein